MRPPGQPGLTRPEPQLSFKVFEAWPGVGDSCMEWLWQGCHRRHLLPCICVGPPLPLGVRGPEGPVSKNQDRNAQTTTVLALTFSMESSRLVWALKPTTCANPRGLKTADVLLLLIFIFQLKYSRFAVLY